MVSGPTAVREAATVMLVRDDPDLHVFMLRRNPRSVFSPGASVFPGGAVDPADRDPVVYARARGLDDARASQLVGESRDGLRFWVAAARESFEEAGFVLGDAGPGLAAARDALNAGNIGWAAALAQHDVVLHLDELAVFAHWLTPEGAPRRYDTWFFVAAAPDDQDGVHDDAEAVHSEWARPRDAIERFRSGELDLILPTLRSLLAASRFRRAADLLDAVRAAQPPRVAPLVVDDGSGQRVVLPGDGDTVAASAARGWAVLRARPDVDRALLEEELAAHRPAPRGTSSWSR
jgi:8-oxo-dGTP pyrophosphatase MutT (NUDIX family)